MDASTYSGLITSEHRQKPKFMAMVGIIAQWAADRQNLLASIPAAFDVDTAVGAQQDRTGEWIGVSRQLQTPLTDVYFSFDTAGLGLDQGTIFGPYDPIDGLTSLPDDTYRLLQYSKIAANNWDGTVPGAYDAWNTIFQPLGYQVLIQDNQDMTMDVGLVGPMPDAVTLALFTNGYLSLVPAGVSIRYYFTQSIPDTPIFALDVSTDLLAGLDEGAWAVTLT